MTNQEEFLLNQQRRFSKETNNSNNMNKRNSFNFNLNFLELNWESELDLLSKDPGVLDATNPN